MMLQRVILVLSPERKTAVLTTVCLGATVLADVID